jgi:hypothetical protein
MELQQGCCFYCSATLSARIEVDHFVPWSRWPNDAIENLVLADRCNSEKSHHIAATVHVDQWAVRLDQQAETLASIADVAGWHSEQSRSLGLVRSCYGHLPVGTPLWLSGSEFAIEPLAPIRDRLAAVGSA